MRLKLNFNVQGLNYNLQWRPSKQTDLYYRKTFKEDELKLLEETTEKLDLPLVNTFNEITTTLDDDLNLVALKRPLLNTILIVDFDKIPKEFKDADEFYNSIYERFTSPDMGCVVTRSFSRMPKIWVFTVNKFKLDHNETLRNAIEWFLFQENKVDATLIDSFDRSYSGMTLSFVTREAIDSIFKQVKENTLKVWPDISIMAQKMGFVEKEAFSSIEPPKAKIEKQIVLSDLPLPKRLLNCSKNRFLVLFLRALVAAPPAERVNQVLCPVTMIAKAIGCHRTTVGRIAKELEDNGFLTIRRVGNSKTKRCSIYELREELLELNKLHWQSAIRSLPVTSIGDGEWYEKLLKLTASFRTQSDYLNYVRTLEGHKEKNRFLMAKKAWKYHALRNPEKVDVNTQINSFFTDNIDLEVNLNKETSNERRQQDVELRHEDSLPAGNSAYKRYEIPSEYTKK